MCRSILKPKMNGSGDLFPLTQQGQDLTCSILFALQAEDGNCVSVSLT